MTYRNYVPVLALGLLLMGSSVSAQEYGSQQAQPQSSPNQPYQQPYQPNQNLGGAQQPMQGKYGNPPSGQQFNDGQQFFQKPDQMMGQQGQPFANDQGMMQKNNPQNRPMMNNFQGSGKEQGQGGFQNGMMSNDQQQGPTDEQMAQQQKQMEEQQKKMDEQRFKMMKQGLSQFKQGTQRMKTQVAQMEKKLSSCGVSMPEELKTAITDSQAAIPKIDAAKDATELESIMDEVSSSGQAMQEWGPKLGNLDRLCQMLKDADNQMKRMTKENDAQVKRVQAKKNLDLSGLIVDLKDQTDQLKQALADARTESKTDPESALSTLQDGFYGSLSDRDNTRQAIEMALNVTQGLKNSDKEIKKYSSAIDRLKKQKKDVGDLPQQLADLKSRQSDIQALLKTKFDPSDLTDLIQEAFDIRDQIVNDLEDLGALNDYMSQAKSSSGVQFQLPKGFGMQENSGAQQNPAQGMQGGGAMGQPAQ